MISRRQCREWAIQLLFHWDMNTPDDRGAWLKEFWSEQHADSRSRKFTERLVCGVIGEKDGLDAKLKALLENWELKRLGAIERNTIRLALYEMHFCEDIPPVVSINEAVDIAKFFSNTEAGRFVNGVLDRARKDIKRDPRIVDKP